MDPIIKRKKAQRCSVMKSVVHIHERTKPLTFTFVPNVQRLPAHVHVVDSRFFLQTANQQNPLTSSSGMNKPLCAAEEPSRDVRLKESIVHGSSGQTWLSAEGRIGSAEGASQIEGIFKAELVHPTDSNGTDSDCFSREAGVDVSVHALPSLSLPQNPFTDDKGSSVRPNVVGDESNVLLLQDADQKTYGALQESLFQSKAASHSPADIEQVTFTIQIDDSSPTDMRRACISPVSIKSPLYFSAKRNTENKSSSLHWPSFFSSTETSFLSSSSFPSALHTKSLSSFNSSVKIPKAASLPSPLSPKHSLSCSDLHSSLLWSSSSLPSLRSTVNSSACVQSSPRSSSQNIQAPTSQQPSCHCPRIHDFFCRPPVRKESAKSSDQSSSLSQLSLLTSILRSGQLTPVSRTSSRESKIVSSATSFSTVGSQSYRKSPTQTSPASSSCQKARPLSPTPGIHFQRSPTMTGISSSVSSRALTSPLYPKPAAHSGHSTPASLSKRQRTSSGERAQTPLPLFSTKHKTHLWKLGNSTPMLSSLRHDTKPPISPHSASPRLLSPEPVYAPSHQQESHLSDKSLGALTSERSLATLPISHSSSLVKCDNRLLNTTSPSLSLSARPFNIFPRLEQSASSSPTSTSPTPVNSSSSSTPVNISFKSGFITPTPLNICPPSLSPMQNQTSPHSSSLKLGSNSTASTYSSSRKPPTPEKLSRQLSPFTKSNFTVNTAARSAERFPHSSTDTPLAGPVKSPPPLSPTPRVGTHSPSQSLSCSTETKQPEQKFKIKSSYKAFAAIPTNTLLLEQKAIDEAVRCSGDSAGQNTSEEAHSQFLFEPKSLRQQSEELYAAIEQVLEDPLPMPIVHIPKSAGRETKYANLHLPSSETTEKRPTRPGVIRPVTIIQKLPATPKLEDNCPNPFRHHSDEINDVEIKKPRHAITTIHENEALGINELVNATTKPIKDQFQIGRSPMDDPDSGEEALMILEEEQEQAIK